MLVVLKAMGLVGVALILLAAVLVFWSEYQSRDDYTAALPALLGGAFLSVAIFFWAGYEIRKLVE